MKQALVRLRDETFLFLDRLLFRRSHPHQDAGVVIVRLDGLGDFLLWMDCALQFREAHPEESLTLVCNSLVEPLATRLEIFDEVIPVERATFRKNLGYRREILRRLTRKRFRLLLNPVFSRTGYFADGEAMVARIQATRKVGFAGETAQRSDRFYTELVEGSPEPLMELDRNAEFMRASGLADFEAKTPRFPESFLPSNGKVSSIPADFFAVHAGSGHPEGRRWPTENFAALIRRIHAESGLTCVLVGTGNEKELAEELLAQIGDLPVLNLVGKTSLMEMIPLISRARLVVGNDSAIAHIGAQTNRPTFMIRGGGHGSRFAPYSTESSLTVLSHPMDCYGCDWRCSHCNWPGSGAFPCVGEVSTEQVWEPISRLLVS